MNDCLLMSKISLNVINDYNFDFLDNIYSNYYYNILNSYEEYKIKNIYKFIYNRILKFSELYNIKKMNNIKNRYISYKYFNDMLSNYINNDILLSIIIMNSIYLYHIPL